jgi:hypothetical protein
VSKTGVNHEKEAKGEKNIAIIGGRGVRPREIIQCLSPFCVTSRKGCREKKKTRLLPQYLSQKTLTTAQRTQRDAKDKSNSIHSSSVSPVPPRLCESYYREDLHCLKRPPVTVTPTAGAKAISLRSPSEDKDAAKSIAFILLLWFFVFAVPL